MSVCNLAAESTVAAIVDALLPRGGSLLPDQKWAGEGDPTRALYIKVRLSLSIYANEEDEDDIMEGATIHLLFERPTNYTKVWSCVKFRGDGHMVTLEDWVMKSDHDSGWRTDGMRDIPQTYLDLLGKVREQAGAERMARLSEYNTIDSIKWAHVTWKHADYSNRHKKLITSAEFLKDT